MVRLERFELPTARFVAEYSIQLSYRRITFTFVLNMAEREGFEPSIRDKPYTPLAGERLQPLGHLSCLSNQTQIPSALIFKGAKDTYGIARGKLLIETFCHRIRRQLHYLAVQLHYLAVQL